MNDYCHVVMGSISHPSPWLAAPFPCLSVPSGAIRGLTIKFANSPCACHGSSGQKPQYDLMTLAYQCSTAMLLLIHGSLLLSGVYYCLRVFRCAVVRMSVLELEQRTKGVLSFKSNNCTRSPSIFTGSSPQWLSSVSED
jgi:hypothetical protein